jgi:hypothetical protein
VLVALLAVGVEMLRRQVIREFPDRVTTYSAEGLAQAIAGRMRAARQTQMERHAAAAEPAAPTPTADERPIEQLERLASLREAGCSPTRRWRARRTRFSRELSEGPSRAPLPSPWPDEMVWPC